MRIPKDVAKTDDTGLKEPSSIA